MSEKPEALRLADDLKRVIRQEDAEDNVILVPRWTAEASVAELLRQHAEIERLKAERDEDRQREYGYSQETVNALTRERDELLATNERLKAVALQAQNAAIDAAMEPATEPAIRSTGEVPR